VSTALATKIGVAPGAPVLIRVERPSAIPIESLHGRKDDQGRTLRLNVRAVLGAADLAEFSLRPQQGSVQAIFVPLKRLQRELDLAGRVNTLLVSERTATLGSASAFQLLQELLRKRSALEDVGVSLRVVDAGTNGRGTLAVEHAGGLFDRTHTQ